MTARELSNAVEIKSYTSGLNIPPGVYSIFDAGMMFDDDAIELTITGAVSYS